MTRQKRRPFAAAVVLCLAASATLATPPARLPVQGAVTDTAGDAVSGSLPVTFTLYADANKAIMVWTETKTVAFDAGFFAESLGDIEPLPLTLFRDEQSLYLGITIDTDSEMPLLEVLPVPFAAYAEHAGDAATLGGLDPASFAGAGADVSFNQLVDVPAGISDGDDGVDFTLASGGGLELSGGQLRLLSACMTGHVLKYTASGWACGVDVTGGAGGATITDAQLVNTTLSIVEGGTNHTVNLASLQDGVNDADADPANERNTNLAFSGTTLSLTDSGGTLTANLASLQDGVNDADADPANERNTTMTLNGTTLELTDSGGTLTADLAPIASGGVRMHYEQGSVGTPTATTDWLCDPAVTTINAGETVQITSSGAFGSTTAGGADLLDLYPCYREVGNTAAPTKIGLGMFNLRVPENTRQTFAINGVVTVTDAGSYEFGMCGDDDGNGNWNNNEWSYTSVVIAP